MMIGRIGLLIAFTGTVLVWTAPACAHSVDKRFGDFYGGMLHPITAIGHLLPIIGLSLLAGQQGPRQARWLLLVFPIGLLVGASFAIDASPSDPIEWVNRISFVIIGALVAIAMRLPLPVLLTIALSFGLTHGYENVVGMSGTVTMRMFLPGILTSGLSLVAFVAAVTVSLKLPWQQIAVRVAGSWIAAIGLLSLGVA